MIENYEQLAASPLCKVALDILIAGITQVLPENFMPGNVTSDGESLTVRGEAYDLRNGNLYVIGGGKAAGAMAVELEKIVEPTAGIVIDKSTDFKTVKISVHRGGHPMPSPEGAAGVRQMLELTNALTERDTVICLISGGGSSLMTYPVEGVELRDVQELTRLVLRAGLTVREINIIRKRLSRVAGGKLARYLAPASVIGLIASDTANPEEETASGPTAVDRSTFDEAYEILKKHRLLTEAPTRIVDYIRKGLRGEVPSDAQNPAELTTRVRNYVLADNATALQAMLQKATASGFKAELYPDRVVGEASEAASRMSRYYRMLHKSGGKGAVISGGETTVTVKGRGRGGRNQEYVAAMIPEIRDCKNAVVASLATDGVDFLEGVGGAIITDSALAQCHAKGLQPEEYLRDNNTYVLHRRLGSLIETQPTHTNVADISIFLTESEGVGYRV